MEFDTKKMVLSHIKNRDYYMHSLRIYNEIQRLGIPTVREREQEFLLQIEQLSPRIRLNVENNENNQNNPNNQNTETVVRRMRPPVVFIEEFEESECDGGAADA